MWIQLANREKKKQKNIIQIYTIRSKIVQKIRLSLSVQQGIFDFFEFLEIRSKIKTILACIITKSGKKHVFLMVFFKFTVNIVQKSPRSLKIIIFYVLPVIIPKKGSKTHGASVTSNVYGICSPPFLSLLRLYGVFFIRIWSQKICTQVTEKCKPIWD